MVSAGGNGFEESAFLWHLPMLARNLEAQQSAQFEGEPDRPMRMVCVANPLGFVADEFFPEKEGKLKSLPRLLKPLTELRSDFSVISNLDTLQVTDFLMKQYLKAADEYLDAAIIQATAKPTKQSHTFNAPFFRESSPADGLNKDGEYMHLRESSSGHGFFLVLEELEDSGGVPAPRSKGIASSSNRQRCVFAIAA